MSAGHAQSAWRRLGAFSTLLAAATAFVAACANQGPPPGGAPDVEPPVILSITPQSMTVTPKLNTVRVRFNEVVSEIPKGSRSLADLVFISPKSGEPRVSWGRDHIDIKPSKGWKPNTVYSIQIKPGLVDLRNNALDSSIKLVFSTGGAIPNTLVQGVVFDWGAGKGLNGAVVEAVAPDSTTYQAVADEQGRYELRNIPPGPYLLRAFADKNSNRTQDALELWDAMPTTVTQNAAIEFYAYQHDTVGLRIQDVAVSDSNRTLKITFDKPYSPQQIFPNGSVRIRTKDSLDWGVKIVQTTRERLLFDSLKAKARQDSLDRIQRAKDDSLTPAARAKRDSLAAVRKADSVANVERMKREQARAAAREAAARRGRNARPAPPKDTTPPPKMNRPAVYNEIIVTLDSALPAQSQFRLQVTGVRSLSDINKSPSRTFTTPKPPKADSGKAPAGPAGAGGRGGAPTGRPPARPPAPSPTPAPVKRDTMPDLFILPSRR